MIKPITLTLSRVSTPLGVMLVATDDQDRLRALDWENYAERMNRLFARIYGPKGFTLVDGDGQGPVFDKLTAFFAGDIHAIDDIEVETGGTPFQREVWAALRQIPAGETWSYGQLAKHIGRPAAVRAVGLANGSNPIGVVVPCHRVIGASGALTGYAGGLERKAWLLDHEQARQVRAA
jgi:methylated-DNA-[protein]-cysteine S-methyltransferase